MKIIAIKVVVLVFPYCYKLNITDNIKTSGTPYITLTILPKKPNNAMVVFSLRGKLNSHANSKDNAIIAEHPHNKK